MSRIVEQSEIDGVNQQVLNVSGTAAQLSPTRLGLNPRSSFIIIPLTAGVTVTVYKGEVNSTIAVNAGITLTANQPYQESTGEGFNCWQGAISAIASGNGTVALIEVFDRGED